MSHEPTTNITMMMMMIGLNQYISGNKI